jgi:phage anti-repressor protein
MQEIIKITEKDGKKAVSARELYNYLSIDDGSHFSRWSKTNIVQMFDNNVDYQSLRHEGENGRPWNDYVLTLDVAKEVSMMSKCENGKRARQYFIECEKQLVAIPDNNKVQEILQQANLLLQSVQLSVSNTKAIEVIEKKIDAIEQKQSIEIKQDYFTILAYCKRNHIQLNFSEAIQKGKIATKLSKEKGIDLRQVSDEKYGYVNSYKESVLKETFQL